jgi:hypothetical protein
MGASQYGQTDTMTFLLDQGADIEATDKVHCPHIFCLHMFLQIFTSPLYNLMALPLHDYACYPTLCRTVRRP